MGRWVPMVGREGGTVPSVGLAPGLGAERPAFAATHAGFFRSRDGGRSWEASDNGLGSFAVQSIALSPFFPSDRTLFAGAADGSVYRSTDSGANWSLLGKPGRGSAVVALAVAAVPGESTTIAAGTLADGVFFSGDGGKSWVARNAGLPDLSAIALALSPCFQRDRTAFAATERGLELTSDGGASWREVWTADAGEGVQCLAISPGFADDRTAFAGTVGLGVLRSTDGGATWAPAGNGLAGRCVNALALSPDFPRDRTVMAATEEGIAISCDGGDTWSLAHQEAETILSLSLSGASDDGSGGIGLAGLLKGGVIRSEDAGRSWRAANRGLEAASLVGLALSPGFESDGTLFAWGPVEGILRSVDGGRGWEAASTGLGTATVVAVALSPGFATDGVLYAATSAGVFHSRDRGSSWSCLGLEGREVGLLALSTAYPEQPWVAAATREAIFVSSDAGGSWSEVATPADGEAPVALALARTGGGRHALLVSTWREPTSDQRGRVWVWSKLLPDGPWQRLFWRNTHTQVTALGVPDSFQEDGKLFIANGESVYRVVPDAKERTREGEMPLWLPAGIRSRGYPVVSLAIAPDFGRSASLVAAAGDGVHVSRDGGARWQRLGETLGGRSPVAVALPPSFVVTGVVYALAIGGRLWCWDPTA